jgi:hypothetical protein
MVILEPLIREAVNAVHVEHAVSHPNSLPLKSRVGLLCH